MDSVNITTNKNTSPSIKYMGGTITRNTTTFLDENNTTDISADNGDSSDSSSTLSDPPSPSNDSLSDDSSTLSSLSATPSPPATAQHADAASENSRQKVQEFQRTDDALSVSVLGPTFPPGGEDAQDGSGGDVESIRKDDRWEEKGEVRKPRKKYEVECAHTDFCTCRMHAAHPSARVRTGLVRAQFPHLSEWALAVKHWPESALRSTMRKEGERGEGGKGV